MIRLYQETDTEDLIDVWYQASSIAHSFLTDTFLEEEKAKLPEVFLPNSQTWVYEAEGEVVGFISLVGNEVGGLFVRPSRQRQGIGQALMCRPHLHRECLSLEALRIS